VPLVVKDRTTGVILVDNQASCKNMRCRKRFDISGVKTMAFIGFNDAYGSGWSDVSDPGAPVVFDGERTFAPERADERPWWWAAAVLLAAGPLYGLCMGSFSSLTGERWPLLIFSAIKVPLLLSATTALCVPPFFVFNTVLGLRADFRAALQAIIAAQAAVAVTLTACGPLTLMWYASVDDYRAALLFNGGVFAVAAVGGQLVVRRYYRVLIARNRLHRRTLLAWLVLYVFVGIQMGWTLRPFVGSPEAPVAFFRPEPFTNAYEVVLRLIWGG